MIRTIASTAAVAALALTILSPLAVVAATPANPSKTEVAKDDPAWLKQCVKQADANGEGSTLGWAHCMVDHREALIATQAKLVAGITTALAGEGPDGIDYGAARQGFALAQQHWKAFVDADCGLVDNVFGTGTAQGLAGEDCVISRYQARNAQLRELQANYLTQ